MLISAAPYSFVPNVCKPFHCLWLSSVQPFKEGRVNRSAVSVDSVSVKSHCGNQKAFVACHDVRKVSEALWSVAIQSDVNVYSAHMDRVAFLCRVCEGC